MRQPARSSVAIGLLVTCIAAAAGAQTVVTGAIEGTVIDASKTTLPRVDVLARNIDTGRQASATTNENGRFRIVGLQPGHYIIDVNASGFEPLDVATLVVEVGRTTTVDISLDPARVRTGAAPGRMSGINSSAQGFSLNLTQSSFDDLPNNAGPPSQSWLPRPPRMALPERSVFAASAAC
jgi:Carboxypeptidase regulatory-like domain